MNLLNYKNPTRQEKLNIWPHQQDNNPALIESMINHENGLSTRIYARKLSAIVIDAKTSRSFLDDNHLDGFATASFHYGLVDENSQLFMVLTIGKSRFSQQHDFEIIRLASLKNHAVVGGASKLLKFAIPDLHGKLLTYSDRKIGDGKVYEKLGFTHLGTTKPGYFWMKDDQILSRHQCQKHRLEKLLGPIDLTKTESQIMIEHGWTKVFDFGHDRWELVISDSHTIKSALVKTWWVNENGQQRRGIPNNPTRLGRKDSTTSGKKWVLRDGKRMLVDEILQTDQIGFHLQKSNKGKKVILIDGKKKLVDEIPEGATLPVGGTTTGRIGMKSPKGTKKLVTLEEARQLAKLGWVIAAKQIRNCPQHVKDFAKELEKEKGSF